MKTFFHNRRCSWLIAGMLLLCALGAPAAAQLVNTGFPVVQIWTDGAAPIVSRETYLNGRMTITDGSRTVYRQG